MAVVTVTATGLGSATAPNNFTISIVNSSDVVTQYATNVSRASLISGYNVTVQPGDVYVRVASTGVCTYSTQIDVSSGALQDYRPDPIEPTTFGGSPETFIAGGGRDGVAGSYELVIGSTDVYPFMNASDFTLTHVSTVGGLSTGPFLAGTLGTRIVGPNSDVLELFGETRTSYTPDGSTNTSTYRVTYTPTGLSRDFNFYWFVE
jgi:hypothetical protein